MRRILWMLSVILLVSLLYYLLIRPFEFEVNFKAKTLPGDLIETLRIWNRSLDSAKVIEIDSFSRLKQTIIRNNRRYVYNWHFVVMNDSLTKVNVHISEPNRSLLNKLLIPFTEEVIEKDGGEIVREFYDVLKTHLEITDVKLIGEAELDPIFCVCRSLQTNQIEKANGMMTDFLLLTSFINDLKFEPDGLPMVRINQWSHSMGTLRFEFCFPIVPTDSLPDVDLFTYKKFNKVKVLKAEYYGNYITSDRAWYALLHYAGRKGYKVKGLPIEYFHDNPNFGMNESKWKADVYLPID